MPRGIEEHAPDIVPPLFEIQMDEEFTAVITNESIQRDLTKIDIWEKNKYLGSVEIPILYTQNFVFPPIFNFPTGICLQGGKLYSLHYDLEKDLYRVCTWKLKF